MTIKLHCAPPSALMPNRGAASSSEQNADNYCVIPTALASSTTGIMMMKVVWFLTLTPYMKPQSTTTIMQDTSRALCCRIILPFNWPRMPRGSSPITNAMTILRVSGNTTPSVASQRKSINSLDISITITMLKAY